MHRATATLALRTTVSVHTRLSKVRITISTCISSRRTLMLPSSYARRTTVSARLVPILRSDLDYHFFGLFPDSPSTRPRPYPSRSRYLGASRLARQTPRYTLVHTPLSRRRTSDRPVLYELSSEIGRPRTSTRYQILPASSWARRGRRTDLSRVLGSHR